MSIGEQILNKMIKEGADIPTGKRAEVIEEVNKAVEDSHFFIIEKDGSDIGFLTYFEKGDKVFINNCVVYRKFRSVASLMSLRRFFRSAYEGKRFYWRSKKRNGKLCFVK